MLQSGLNLTVSRSSVVIKVGDSAKINLTLSNFPAGFGRVCFGLEGFPTSEFVTQIAPACASSQQSGQTASVLTVEATPAAAPQSFTAFVVASSGNWTQSAPVNITVEAAMPAWIPWSIILVFILILIVPLTIKTKKKTLRRKQSWMGRSIPVS
jgi:hypothetical protein